MNPNQTYDSLLSSSREKEAALKKKANSIYLGRLLFGLGIFILSYFTLKSSVSWPWVVALLGDVIVFFYLVKQHIRVKNEIQFQENYSQCAKDELGYLKGDFSPFNNGLEYLKPEHPFALDLDILGEASLYQRVNRSVTQFGNDHVAEELLQPYHSITETEKAFNTYKAFSSKKEWLLAYRAKGKLNPEQPGDVQKLEQFFTSDYALPSKALPFLLLALPATTIITVLLALFSIVSSSWVIIPIVVNWLFISFHSKTVNKIHAIIGDRVHLLSKYKSLLEHVLTLPDDTVFKEKKIEAERLLVPIRQLERFLELLDFRLNIVIQFLGNSLFLFDLQVLHRLLNWKKEHSDTFSKVVTYCAAMDVTQSMATFFGNHPSFTQPIFETTEKPFATCNEVTHPFLPTESAVTNSFSIGKNGTQYIILTGANMAGKSTFLRTIGINWVMAQAGLPVCAKNWQSSQVYLLTSMRLSDSLKDDASYFKAEVSRLQLIVNSLETQKPSLVLLDEILRGTNSDDKRKGTYALMQQLSRYNAVGLLATHDIELAELQSESEKYKAMRFESAIVNNALSFDYLLQEGVASSTNASEILRIMGVIKDLKQ